MNRTNYLNSQQVRDLLARGELAEPDEPRPTGSVYVNQTHIHLTTWHRSALPMGTKNLIGSWVPRTVSLPASDRNIAILKQKRWNLLSASSRKALIRLEYGWKPRQQKAHSTAQFAAA